MTTHGQRGRIALVAECLRLAVCRARIVPHGLAVYRFAVFD